MPSPSTSSRCGHCGGALRADAPWCTLCLTPTGPVHAPEPQPLPAPSPVMPGFASARPAVLDPLTAPLELLLGEPGTATGSGPATSGAAPSWPCASCSTPNALDRAVCATCGAGFLAAVARDEPPLLALPLVGDVTGWTKLHWLAVGVVLLLLGLVVIVAGGALLG